MQISKEWNSKSEVSIEVMLTHSRREVSICVGVAGRQSVYSFYPADACSPIHRRIADTLTTSLRHDANGENRFSNEAMKETCQRIGAAPYGGRNLVDSPCQLPAVEGQARSGPCAGQPCTLGNSVD